MTSNKNDCKGSRETPLPEYLRSGIEARLFPVLSTTSKEGRTTSIVLACFGKIEEFSAKLLSSVGMKIGKRATVKAWTEVVFSKQATDIKDRPDGLIAITIGKRRWRALVETKIGNNDLDPNQIERYRMLAKENDIDCLITISNHFATSPNSHPLEEVRKSRSKIPVFHWSWMYVLTTADLLLESGGVENPDQCMLLNELRRFLTHESAGVKGFDRFPREWTELNRLVSNGGAISPKSEDARAVISAWHQETRDLSLILSRMTYAGVIEKLSKKHMHQLDKRRKDELAALCENQQLTSSLFVPNSAASIDIIADLSRRSIDVGMSLEAPKDRVSTKARVNWLLRQIKNENVEGLNVRLLWPRTSETTQHSIAELREDINMVAETMPHLAVREFHLFLSVRLGAKFTQQIKFISEIERIVPEFYRNFGQNLTAWKQKPPKIGSDRQSGEDVSTEGLYEESKQFAAESKSGH
ncbi:MAG: hypothetical protein OXC72_02300 [Roseovarius sp.]|nr:hypothetical protein [Roseovarius sp.]MCY4315475.1 hypothetical protein [Roseovarius sp.]